MLRGCVGCPWKRSSAGGWGTLQCIGISVNVVKHRDAAHLCQGCGKPSRPLRFEWFPASKTHSFPIVDSLQKHLGSSTAERERTHVSVTLRGRVATCSGLSAAGAVPAEPPQVESQSHAGLPLQPVGTIAGKSHTAKPLASCSEDWLFHWTQVMSPAALDFLRLKFDRGPLVLKQLLPYPCECNL